MKTFVLILLMSLGFFSTTILASNNDSLNTRIDAALQNATLWLAEDSLHFKPETFIIHSYLERKFNAPPITNNEAYIVSIENNKRKYPKLYPFMRFVKPNLKITEQQIRAITNPMNKLLAAAIWVDQVELYDNYIKDMKYHLTLDGYYMTHVYYGIQFLKEHNAAICQTEEFKALEKESLRLLKQYIIDHPYPGDITIEALVFLAYTNQGEGFVTKEIIEKILDIQLDNGAWYFAEHRHVEEQHTVILAMWLLYEYRYPDAQKIAWVLK